MFKQITDKVNSPEFRAAAKEVATQVVTTLVVAVAVKAIGFVVVKGTQALIEEIGKGSESTTE